MFASNIVVAAYEAISIGNDVQVGEFTSIRDADHGMDRSRPMNAQPMQASPVKIADDVWLGRGVAVLKGVNIGHGVVVGANSVVIRDIASYAVVAGIPARRIKERVTSVT